MWPDAIRKGNKPRRLQVPPELLAFCLLPETSRNDPTPLVLSSRGRGLAHVTDEAAPEAMKAAFSAAALVAAN